MVIVSKKLMYFQIYELDKFKPQFKYEIYYDMEYTKLSEKFHTFEIEDCVAGLVFADRNEASKVFKVVNEYKPKRTFSEYS